MRSTSTSEPCPPRWPLRKLSEIGEVESVCDLRTILIDVDSPFRRRLVEIDRAIGRLHVPVVWVRYSRSSRGGWHVVVRLRDAYPIGEIIAMQALCYSDRDREIFNLRRAIAYRQSGRRSRFWRERVNLLFSRKVR